MKWNTSLFYVAIWMVLLYFAPIYRTSQKHLKYSHGSRTSILQRRQSVKKSCFTFYENQTAVDTPKCGSGFYRKWTGPDKARCVPCSCNGLSSECDELTGNCVNCLFNTTGDRCERCKEGYYGNPANRTCRACPCPFMQKNFALACMEISHGVVECLCKKGYIGPTCERCAFGYYGNPMVDRGMCKRCSCTDSSFCDSLTGECIIYDNSSYGANCHERDICAYSLLPDLRKVDAGLAWLKQQLNITHGSASPSRRSRLQANVSETMQVQLIRFRAAVKHLDLKAEQLETDVALVRNDLSQLTEKTLSTSSGLEKVLANVTAEKFWELLYEAEGLLSLVEDLITQQTKMKSEESGPVSKEPKARMMEEAEQILQEIRNRGCAAQRDHVDTEQEGARKLLNLINMRVPAETLQAILNQSKDSLMASDSSGRKMAELLLSAEDTVNRTQVLNLKSFRTIQHLQHVVAQLEREQRTLHPEIEITQDLLSNITNIFSTLEEIKEELQNIAAQMGGAELELFKKLNNVFQSTAKVDPVTEAEEHAGELNRVVSVLQQVPHDVTSSTQLLRIPGVGAYCSIVIALETAELAANQSRVAADQALKDVKEGGLSISAGEMKDNSAYLCTEANDTQSQLKILSHAADTNKDSVNERKKKWKSLTGDISAVGDDIKKIKRDDVELMIKSVKGAASAVNSRVSNVKERLGNISLSVERITLTNISVNIDDMLRDAYQALRNFNRKFPLLSSKLAQISALAGKSTFANMTETIWRIRDVVDETRSFVNRLSIATTFDGNGHIELHPPRNLEDIAAFTAVDLLLNRHDANPSKTDHGRKRRQHRDRDADLFVFYLGNRDSSGDYIGMAIRNAVLICFYKLGGVIHKVETSQITITTVNSSDFDRVVFHRIYQDAEVNVTQHFTSRKPISLPPKSNLPSTMSGVLTLDPNSTVFYVGGYPEDFTPPEELHYRKYRGAMKLSYINDNPVCLFNYKHAVNMNAKQPTVKIPQAEVSDYYQGTGYRMAHIKEPGKKKRRLFKFHTNSREKNAFLFYIGNEESFWCVFVERGLLVLQGQQGDRKLRVQSPDSVSLFDKQFAVIIADTFTVHYGSKQISTYHIQTNYTKYYIGGLPAQLRRRHNITAAPLRGCMDHTTADAEVIEYNRTIGVSGGCPVSLLIIYYSGGFYEDSNSVRRLQHITATGDEGVRAATLYSALAVDSLFVWNGLPLRVSLGFRSTDRHAVILKASSQGFTSAQDLQLSLVDGFILFKSYNYTLTSDKRYNDGVWHYVSADGRPTGLELSTDNTNAIQRQSPHIRQKGGTFKACIANIYVRRPDYRFTPADLSVLSQVADVVPDQCSLHPPSHSELLRATTPKRPQMHKPTPAGTQCRRLQTQREYQFTEADSWLSYTLPHDLKYRPHFSLDIKTKSSKGLILRVAGRGVVPLLALYMANGKIRMSLGQNRTIQHKQKSNDGNWHRVEFSVEKSTFHLLVDGFRVTDGHLQSNEGSSLQLHYPIYLGGDLKRRTTNIPMDSIIGCIRDFKMNEVTVSEPDSSHKTIPCFGGLTEMGTYFGGGHIVSGHFFNLGANFVLTFELRPQRPAGLLFHFQRDDKSSLDVYLMKNKVSIRLSDGDGAVSVVMPHESLCDGQFHVVTVSRKNAVIKLEVDSMSEEKAGTSSSSSAADYSLHIGGTTNHHGASVSLPFVGCLKNMYFNGRSVLFEPESRVVGLVSINRCPSVI